MFHVMHLYSFLIFVYVSWHLLFFQNIYTQIHTLLCFFEQVVEVFISLNQISSCWIICLLDRCFSQNFSWKLHSLTWNYRCLFKPLARAFSGYKYRDTFKISWHNSSRLTFDVSWLHLMLIPFVLDILKRSVCLPSNPLKSSSPTFSSSYSLYLWIYRLVMYWWVMSVPNSSTW